MNLCSKNHDEICFEGRNCPFCDYIERTKLEIKDLETYIDKLEEEEGEE